MCKTVFNQYTQIVMKIHSTRKNGLIYIYCTDQTHLTKGKPRQNPERKPRSEVEP